MLWVYGHYNSFNFFSVCTVFKMSESDVSRRQILTSEDGPRDERGK